MKKKVIGAVGLIVGSIVTLSSIQYLQAARTARSASPSRGASVHATGTKGIAHTAGTTVGTRVKGTASSSRIMAEGAIPSARRHVNIAEGTAASPRRHVNIVEGTATQGRHVNIVEGTRPTRHVNIVEGRETAAVTPAVRSREATRVRTAGTTMRAGETATVTTSGRRFSGSRARVRGGVVVGTGWRHSRWHGRYPYWYRAYYPGISLGFWFSNPVWGYDYRGREFVNNTPYDLVIEDNNGGLILTLAPGERQVVPRWYRCFNVHAQEIGSYFSSCSNSPFILLTEDEVGELIAVPYGNFGYGPYRSNYGPYRRAYRRGYYW